MRPYHYVGPAAIRDRPRAEPGAEIRAPADLDAWLRRHPGAVHEGVTYVVDLRGVLRVAPRRSEHIDCAGGEPVLAAGELFLARRPEGSLAVVDLTNLSTGYCPDPECWPAVAAALAAARLPGPAGFTRSHRFRRCTACGQTNVIKDDWLVCALCDSELPTTWNFA